MYLVIVVLHHLDVESSMPKAHLLKRYLSEFELVTNELQGLLVLHPLICINRTLEETARQLSGIEFQAPSLVPQGVTIMDKWHSSFICVSCTRKQHRERTD